MPKTSRALDQTIRTPAEASRAGYEPLTNSYLTHEEDMLQRAADQLARGNIQHIIVQTDNGKELWRRYGRLATIQSAAMIGA